MENSKERNYNYFLWGFVPPADLVKKLPLEVLKCRGKEIFLHSLAATHCSFALASKESNQRNWPAEIFGRFVQSTYVKLIQTPPEVSGLRHELIFNPSVSFTHLKSLMGFKNKSILRRISSVN
jgi:hypothetical protein